MSQVLQHVVGAIGPASQVASARAHDALAGVGAPMLERLAASLAGAQHAWPIRVARRTLVVAIGDHGCGDPGIPMGPDHPTVIAAHAIADGSAAVCQLARPATPIVVVEAGAREPSHLPSIAVPLGRGPSRDLLREPAQTVVDAVLGLEAGIALSLTLTEPAAVQGAQTAPALDVVALGALGLGAELASAALLAALTGVSCPLGEPDPAADRAQELGIAAQRSSALELLALFGGSDTSVLAGLMLGLASMNIPVILDGHATGAAALVAAALAPELRGYLIAAHRGGFTMPAIIEHLGLTPVFDVGLGHGEGTGAAMVLPLLDQVAALASRRG